MPWSRATADMPLISHWYATDMPLLKAYLKETNCHSIGEKLVDLLLEKVDDKEDSENEY